jgi:hypothetical protein
MTLAFLVTWLNVSLAEAFKMLKTRRIQVNPNPDFWLQLEEWEVNLRGSSTLASTEHVDQVCSHVWLSTALHLLQLKFASRLRSRLFRTSSPRRGSSACEHCSVVENASARRGHQPRFVPAAWANCPTPAQAAAPFVLSFVLEGKASALRSEPKRVRTPFIADRTKSILVSVQQNPRMNRCVCSALRRCARLTGLVM